MDRHLEFPDLAYMAAAGVDAPARCRRFSADAVRSRFSRRACRAALLVCVAVAVVLDASLRLSAYGYGALLENSVAFAWPYGRSGKMKYRSSPRSKQNLIGVLKDVTTHSGKSLWAVKNLVKFGFMTSSWEYTLAMKKLTKVGQPGEALELWQRMRSKGLEQSPASYSAAVVALQTTGQWRDALQIADEAKLRNMVLLKVGNEFALQACERGGQWERAIGILDQMWEAGEEPTEEIAGLAIRACENAGQYVLANDMFRQYRERTKLTQVAEEAGLPVNHKNAPKAALAPWRIPGAVDPKAYEPPALAAKRLEEERVEKAVAKKRALLKAAKEEAKAKAEANGEDWDEDEDDVVGLDDDSILGEEEEEIEYGTVPQVVFNDIRTKGRPKKFLSKRLFQQMTGSTATVSR
eukprot:TRINITY_DN101497_c0_g1_i1.p1 TRINITY_DN101497_c0_g1~~TRINITY_DN101497_c0_g1_i1.p1  ORF type:complete len:408 (-),score=121.59 TRINITY_DN101497_c0_g1_i1:6-1229(-)